MAKPAKYFLCVRADGVVGPHSIRALRVWVATGVIARDWKVCKEGEDNWINVSEIPKFDDFPPSLRERLDALHNQKQEQWRLDPPTDKQLKKLKFFMIPFETNGLTKGRASDLIDAYEEIDPVLADQYENRPATPAQIKRVLALGGDPTNLTYRKAVVLIDDLEFDRELEKEDAKAEKQAAKDAVEFDLAYLENFLNSPDWRESYNYKKLSLAQVRKFLAYVKLNVPRWAEMTTHDLCALVPKVLPEQLKAERAASGKSSKRAKSKGCLVFILALPFVILITIWVSLIAIL